MLQHGRVAGVALLSISCEQSECIEMAAGRHFGPSQPVHSIAGVDAHRGTACRSGHQSRCPLQVHLSAQRDSRFALHAMMLMFLHVSTSFVEQNEADAAQLDCSVAS